MSDTGSGSDSNVFEGDFWNFEMTLLNADTKYPVYQKNNFFATYYKFESGRKYLFRLEFDKSNVFEVPSTRPVYYTSNMPVITAKDILQITVNGDEDKQNGKITHWESDTGNQVFEVLWEAPPLSSNLIRRGPLFVMIYFKHNIQIQIKIYAKIYPAKTLGMFQHGYPMDVIQYTGSFAQHRKVVFIMHHTERIARNI